MMNDIKVGDWVEVVEPTKRHRRIGINIGDRYEVLSLGSSDDVFVKPKDCTFMVGIHYGRIKKVEKPKIEKQDTNKENNRRIASDHYHQGNNGNDVWQFMDDNLSEERVKGFHQGNALKYITRYNSKHDTKEKRIEDLKKAKVYIDKLIELEG